MLYARLWSALTNVSRVLIKSAKSNYFAVLNYSTLVNINQAFPNYLVCTKSVVLFVSVKSLLKPKEAQHFNIKYKSLGSMDSIVNLSSFYLISQQFLLSQFGLSLSVCYWAWQNTFSSYIIYTVLHNAGTNTQFLYFWLCIHHSGQVLNMISLSLLRCTHACIHVHRPLRWPWLNHYLKRHYLT